MGRLYLLLAFSIFLEVIGTTSMKLSEGFTNLGPSLLVVIGYGGALLSYIYLATRIELGVIYAIWSGTGTALIAAVGVLAFNESVSAMKLLGLVLVVAGVVGLNLKLGERGD